MATTVAQLLSRVRSRVDLGAASSSPEDDFIQRSELLDWLNQANARLFNFLARRGLILREASLDVTANGASSYQIGTNATVYSIIRVARIQGNWVWELQRHSSRQKFASSDVGDAQSYRVFEGAAGALNMELWPVPATGTYRLWYVPACTPLVSDADQVYYPQGWDEILVVEAAIKCRQKEENPDPGLLTERDRLWADVEIEAEARELNETNVVEWSDGLYPPGRDLIRAYPADPGDFRWNRP